MTNQNIKGFTLLEVMIAMAVLAVALTILLGSVNSGVIFGGNSRDTTIATFLAQEKMTELERKRELLAAGSSESGRFKDEFERFEWEYTITLDETSMGLVEMAGVNIPFEPMKVEVKVSWGKDKNKRTYMLQEMLFPVVVTR